MLQSRFPINRVVHGSILCDPTQPMGNSAINSQQFTDELQVKVKVPGLMTPYIVTKTVGVKANKCPGIERATC